jgi:uncharacterized protein (DUF2252 family)
MPTHSRRELLDAGRRLRDSVPRKSLAALATGPRDPLGILDEQNAGRLQHLIPLRTERMSSSAFAFYRGTAALMAADLAGAPHTGQLVAACGDAHVSNFGFYASPQRTLVFDLNDFDEAAWAPWDWDLKRLVTSVVIAARARNSAPRFVRKAALHAAASYQRTLYAGIALSPTDRYFTHLTAEAGLERADKQSRRALRQSIAAAQKRTGARAVSKLTTRGDDGTLRFVHAYPTMTPHEPETLALFTDYLERYRVSANYDIQLLLQHYTAVGWARRVVGVGSVGTRCSLTLFQDGDGNALILQSKEANRSVLEQYGGIQQPEVLTRAIEASGQGQRVVAMQRIQQALSDPFLGYLRTTESDLYVRQFHDMKGGVDIELLDDAPFLAYASACAITLARAHSQTPNIAAVVGYIGKNDEVARAVTDWSLAYADLSEQDFAAFVAANSAG